MDTGQLSNAHTAKGATALTSAAAHTEGARSVAHLLNAGARTTRAPLVIAAEAGSLDSVRAILAHFANEHVPGMKAACDRAAQRGDTEMLTVLMDWESPGQADLTNHALNSALTWALRRN